MSNVSKMDRVSTVSPSQLRNLVTPRATPGRTLSEEAKALLEFMEDPKEIAVRVPIGPRRDPRKELTRIYMMARNLVVTKRTKGRVPKITFQQKEKGRLRIIDRSALVLTKREALNALVLTKRSGATIQREQSSRKHPSH